MIRTLINDAHSRHMFKCCQLSYLQLKHLYVSSFKCDEVKVNIQPKKENDMSKYPASNIRNFGIIAHVDHGKSTLSDRLLQMTNTIPAGEVAQYLDKLQVEKERGITVKAQTVSLFHRHEGQDYLLNLIDTPGHVDFAYEVWRTLPACQGALLLIDANSGVQAQTVAHFNHAILSELPIIPVINKIDLKNANPEAVVAQLQKLFSLDESEIIKISAKQGINIDKILEAIINRIPAPKASLDKPLRALLFDSWHDKYKGVVTLMSILDGSVKLGDEIHSMKTGTSYQVKDLGIISPDEQSTDVLQAGQVGYLIANIRDISEAKLGDIFVHKSEAAAMAETANIHQVIIPESKPMVYAGIFPGDQSETLALKSALQKIILTDPSVEWKPESSAALGNGFRLGFLGLLHMEVFNQRLEQEFDAMTVITAPSVPYKVKIIGAKNIKLHGTDTLLVNNPMKLPDIQIIEKYFEPMVNATIITPDNYMTPVTSLCMERRGQQVNTYYIDNTRLMMQYKFPLSEVIVDFCDQLKSRTSGYASFDYEDAGYEETHLARLDILLNDLIVEELSQIVHFKRARDMGSDMCKRLKETLPSQQYAIKIQAAVGKQIVGREDLKALRKDVAAKLYGGDRTRRQKLLARQKEGKDRMRSIGNIEVPRDTFIRILKR
ncbi:Translation factor GUF1 -like protein, mitochondrial [Halotydeus destructor]|nr:Translation factor GUF1 -like protein, mitochondrial [Halotydeus destructor]